MSVIINLATLATIATLGRQSSATLLVKFLTWYDFSSVWPNPETRQAMETWGSYEKTRADLT